MNFYVAGYNGERTRTREIQGLVSLAGHAVTFDWTSQIGPREPEALRLWAHNDIRGVQQCDVLIAICEHPAPYRGLLCEIGAALALNRPVWLLGDGLGDMVFSYHPNVIRFASLDQLWQALLKGGNFDETNPDNLRPMQEISRASGGLVATEPAPSEEY